MQPIKICRTNTCIRKKWSKDQDSTAVLCWGALPLDQTISLPSTQNCHFSFSSWDKNVILESTCISDPQLKQRGSSGEEANGDGSTVDASVVTKFSEKTKKTCSLSSCIKEGSTEKMSPSCGCLPSLVKRELLQST